MVKPREECAVSRCESVTITRGRQC